MKFDELFTLKAYYEMADTISFNKEGTCESDPDYDTFSGYNHIGLYDASCPMDEYFFFDGSLSGNPEKEALEWIRAVEDHLEHIDISELSLEERGFLQSMFVDLNTDELTALGKTELKERFDEWRNTASIPVERSLLPGDKVYVFQDGGVYEEGRIIGVSNIRDPRLPEEFYDVEFTNGTRGFYHPMNFREPKEESPCASLAEQAQDMRSVRDEQSPAQSGTCRGAQEL